VPRFLTQEWMDRRRELEAALPSEPSARARVQHVVTGGVDGEVRYVSVVEEGRVVEERLGVDPEVDFTLTTTWDDAVRVAQGELEPEVAYMQGRAKLAGDMAAFLRLVPAMARPEHREVRAELAAETDR
jgi:putative sterol carrier protein